MSILGALFGTSAAASAVTNIADTVATGLDGLFTSDDERLTHGEVMKRIEQRPYLAQIKLNMVEASHRTIFVAGWRPFIGWVCGAGIAYHFIFQPIIAWGMAFAYPELIAPPVLDFAPLLTLVMSLLGLGVLRTAEKARGLAR